MSRETVLPLYIGLLVYNQTRKRCLIDTLFNKGLSVSYERVLQLTTNIANSEIETYEQECVVCPSQLRNTLFTTGALDNIAHNPSSTTCKECFHGTGISITQHTAHDNVCEIRDIPAFREHQTPNSTIKALPTHYTDVPPVSMLKDMTSPFSLHTECTMSEQKPNTDNELTQQWLEKVRSYLSSDQQHEANTASLSW